MDKSPRQQILEDEALARMLSAEKHDLGFDEAELPQDTQAEVEDMWASWLRGEDVLDVVSEVDSEAASRAYALHAAHALLSEFRRAPAHIVRQAFAQTGTYSEARKLVEESGEAQKLKSKRPIKPAPPCEVPKRLEREKKLGPRAFAVSKALKKRREAYTARVKALRSVGGLGTCGCCFDDEVLPEDELRCSAAGAHSFCIVCVKRASLEFFGNGLFTLNLAQTSSSSISSSSSSSQAALDLSCAVLRCMHTSGCDGHIPEGALRRALPTKDYVRYSRRSAALQAAKSGLQDLVACPACDFMVEMSDHNDSVVVCLDPECGKVTCRWCRQPEHSPLRCSEVEKDSETRIRTFLEERMAEAHLRRCPNPTCRKPYEKTEGCNHMRCPCGTRCCFLCGEELDKNRPYDHFKDGHLGGGRDKSGSRCVVYGTPAWAQKSTAQLKEDAERALDQYLKDNPELEEVAHLSGGARRKRLQSLVEQHGPNKRARGQDPRQEDAESGRAREGWGLCIVQ
eukprot:TRINITY_DN20729_c0_g1_i1.p1 TRINITY_DN20729_c0_g1~~TRINITY_DN20729_c0_g1_i1.p1  ORF type:complete len:511 (+),score=91.28 TRINITY_DN20729_c0_g1_i1:72-1604(+)